MDEDEMARFKRSPSVQKRLAEVQEYLKQNPSSVTLTLSEAQEALAPWVMFTEDHRPHWPVNWADIYEGNVPEECAWLSNRPATASEASFALTLP